MMIVMVMVMVMVDAAKIENTHTGRPRDGAGWWVDYRHEDGASDSKVCTSPILHCSLGRCRCRFDAGTEGHRWDDLDYCCTDQSGLVASNLRTVTPFFKRACDRGRFQRVILDA